MKDKVLWFSRHEITAAQVADLESLRYEVVTDAKATALASQNLTLTNYQHVSAQLMAIAKEMECHTIAGVFPTLILKEAWDQTRFFVHRSGTLGEGITLLAAHNETRSAEGGKPTFVHGGFFSVGLL
jgi:hypothetical protein